MLRRTQRNFFVSSRTRLTAPASTATSFLKFFAAGTTTSAVLWGAHNYLKACDNQEMLVAHAATIIPIGGSGGNSTSPVFLQQQSSQQAKPSLPPIQPDEDGLCSQIFTGNFSPSQFSQQQQGQQQQPLLRLDEPGAAGLTPLMVAAFIGDVPAIKALLAAGADPEVRVSIGKGNEKLAATEKQQRRYVLRFSRIPDGWTALELALVGGSADAIAAIAEAVTNEVPGGSADKIARDARLLVAGMASLPDGAPGAPMSFLRRLNSPSEEDVVAAAQTALRNGRELRRERLKKRRAQFPLEMRLEAELVGQRHAIHQIASAIRRWENGWSASESLEKSGEQGSPLCVLCLGTSGVGKSKISKLISEYVKEGRVVRRSAADWKAANSDNNGDDGDDDNDDPEQQQQQQLLRLLGVPPQQFNKKKPVAKKKDQKQDDCFIRLDMGEFQHKHENAKLLGAPPGYVGFDSAGAPLVDRLEKCKDHAVVLLDEVEKAHPDILNTFLSVFDEGRLTSNVGKTIDCSNAIFIMTSNLAHSEIAAEAARMRALANSEELADTSNNDNKPTVPTAAKTATRPRKAEPFSRNFKREVLHPILGQYFRRELIGRIDEIVIFTPFTDSELEQLAQRELTLWQRRAEAKHRIHLHFTQGTCRALSKEHDERYGARSLKHAVDREIVSAIAKQHELGVIKSGSPIALRLRDEEPPELFLSQLAQTSSTQNDVVTVECGQVGPDNEEIVMDIGAPLPEPKTGSSSSSGGGLLSRWFS